jgi:hypothetical protein
MGRGGRRKEWEAKPAEVAKRQRKSAIRRPAEPSRIVKKARRQSSERKRSAMQGTETRPANPELKELVVEASRALVRLDADRLEELALSCQALNRSLPMASMEERLQLAEQARDATEDMAVFARVLEVTRDNLNVMNRLRELRSRRLEYSERQVLGETRFGSGYGHN